MEGKSSSSVRFSGDDTSLGILNMDRLKVFGDLSHDSLKNSYVTNSGTTTSDRRISDRLNMERNKALEILEKSAGKSPDVFKKPLKLSANKENMKSTNNASNTENSMPLDHTDYVPFRRPNTINISELVTDETINLETTSSNPPSACKDAKISFEPNEITGRSTLYKKEIRNNKPTKHVKNISVDEILASSFAVKTRNLCKTLNNGDTSMDSSGVDKLLRLSTVSSSTVGSSFGQYQDKSLPRTADMSMSKQSLSQLSFCAGAGAGDESGLSNEEFAPGELMQSRLIMDEISWAQEYAAIPAKTLSQQAKEKAAISGESLSNGFDSPSASNSIIAGDPNFSVGNFFQMRSENIWDMVKSKSPDKCRTPFALVDEDDSNMVSTSNIITEDAPSVAVTPLVDNKTYTRVSSLVNAHESKDSGNASENSYLLSISAIGRALENLDGKQQSVSEISSVKSSTIAETPKIDNKTYTRVEKDIAASQGHVNRANVTENSYLLSMSAIDRALEHLDIDPENTSISGLTEQLITQAKKSKSCMNPHSDNATLNGNGPNASLRPKSGTSLYADIKLSAQEAARSILENKENVDPITGRGSNGSRIDLSDTISFTESLLNSSDLKRMERSQTQQPRSPLSPIEVISTAPNIQVIEAVDDGVEADNDEWPGTPKQNVSRRVRRKSPRDRSPLKLNVPDSPDDYEDGGDVKTPVNSRQSRSFSANKKSAVNSDKEPKSLCSTRLDGDPRNAAAECDFGISPNLSSSKIVSTLMTRNGTHLSPRSANDYRMDSSPSSSRYHLSSPTPVLDSTTTSDRQLLTPTGGMALRKSVSSPVGSEASSTCSYTTMHSARSTVSGSNTRSISRCSSSSEFSHRDGKQVPLKVTTLELSWGSIKLRSDSRKSMQIKNIVNKRLVLRIEVSGPGFQIVNSERSNTITLHPQECRSINISFCPTVRGVAIGKLSFYAPTGATNIGQSFLEVALYGFGGNANVVPQNILMGPVGSPFVTMGDICGLAQPLERTISFYNKGPLLAFAVVSIDSLGLLLPRLSDAFEIYPQRILIPPQQTVEAHIIFKPRREEIRKMLKKMRNVLTLANMRVICGDEANRQRIRRLLRQMNERERAKMSSNVLDMLWTKFEDEVEMKELEDIHENPSVAMDLTSGFRIHEILLTINHDNMDETADASSLFLPDGDETVLFRTVVCAADSPTPTTSSSLGTVDEIYEEEKFAASSTHQRMWSVKPTNVEINLKRRQSVSIFVLNSFKSRQYFEVACNKKQLLRFQPSEGYVAPDNGQIEVVIDVDPAAKEDDFNEDVFIMVYMENERITVPVKLVNKN
ncbi:centrosome assembly protein spindle defective 2 isoform X2 [Haematobia irritans]|uniref:centrosome assembly protein spindle defective 2 isoform X2 n=1 Tax=Haematobia irritans TaxID=7368 RepID=UPI003F4F66F2